MSNNQRKFIKKGCSAHKKPCSKIRNKIFPVIIAIFMIIFTASCFYYLLLINKNATNTYVIDDLETKAEQLKTTRQKLELTVMELGQINNIEDKARTQLKMVVADNIDYLKVYNHSVAMR